jgi:hypothetical protein
MLNCLVRRVNGPFIGGLVISVLVSLINLFLGFGMLVHIYLDGWRIVCSISSVISCLLLKECLCYYVILIRTSGGLLWT